jgi:hypothetical protein
LFLASALAFQAPGSLPPALTHLRQAQHHPALEEYPLSLELLNGARAATAGELPTQQECELSQPGKCVVLGHSGELTQVAALPIRDPEADDFDAIA